MQEGPQQPAAHERLIGSYLIRPKETKEEVSPMSNGEFQETEVEIGPLFYDLKLKLSASFWEDENATVPAPNIVSAHEKYHVKVEWDLVGRGRRHFCGKWRVKLDLESIGKAPEYSSECREIDMDPCRDVPYTTIFTLSPADVTPDECGTVYLVAVTLTSLDPCDKPGHIWGYCKGPSVMFVP
jgi:hypothetical protein